MKQTVLKTTVAVLGAGLVSYLGTLAVPMLVLFGVMLLDYITGMIKAYIRAELNSKFGIKGILKKLCYMVMVAVGAAVDYLLRGAVIGAGITLDVKLFFGMLVKLVAFVLDEFAYTDFLMIFVEHFDVERQRLQFLY